MIKDAKVYSQIELQAKVDAATPARLIQLLYENILMQLQKSRRALAQTPSTNFENDEHLVKAMDLVMALREALNFNVPSELPHNLDNLYDYLQRRMLSARLNRDLSVVDECIALTETLKSGWDSLCH